MVTDQAPNGGSRTRWAMTAWALTAAVGVLYAICLAGLPDSSDDVEFYLWVAAVSAGTSLMAVVTLARFRYFVLALLTASAAGFAAAYCLALLTYGSGAEDGTVWRGIAGAVLGGVSGTTAWGVMRLGEYRANLPRAT